MRIAIINETSAAARNADIVRALEGRGHELVNCGMKEPGATPELSYMHTSFLSALLLELGRVDYVVGGCGTGQGYLNAVLQYPGVVCGHLLSPLDAWLFSRINGGNCVSLALNQGYGWAGDVNLSLLFDQLFSGERGSGYPPHRAEPQRASRELLSRVSAATHLPFPGIMEALPDEVVGPALSYPGIARLVDADGVGDADLRRALEARLPR
ncbi:MAG: RpiB/LacA/LacB family sugar-phosphate isomerase [Spirochaetes bacterium]|nr:RpiB/LacA/LacB family sugar-phosphate isomerase [Spirochaetota bacterium]MBU1080658.1 RpiB/LacA/LacB family sugar-phosphate isomerase [Spirochaetota bacterium]